MKKAMSIKNRLISALLVLVMMISSLVGTTFAWFTDEVVSAGNKIESGSLKVDLLHKVGDDWISLKENEDHLVFDYKKWEPGFTLVETLKVQNLGSLALKYRLSVEVEAGTATRGDNGEKLADVIDVWVYYGETSASGYDAITAANSGWVKKGTLSEVMKKPTEFINGNLLPTGNVSNDPNVAVGNQTVSIALHMQESAGNEYQGLSVGDIYVNLLATQLSSESDSYGSDYDNGAEFPTFSGSYIASAPVELDNENKVVEDVMLLSDDGTIGAIVPAGTLLKPGTTKVTLNVDTLDKSESNIVANENQNLNAIDVHVAEVAEGNTTPIIVTIEQLLAPGLNMGNYDLYHVEGGVTVAMSHVADATDLDVHNEFTYDPATGDVKVAMASFSEVVTLSDKENAWEGGVDHTWYDASKTELTIANADQLWSFSQIVGNMAEDIEQDSFKGKTVKLIADINLGDAEDSNNSDIIFYPIGYWNNEGTYERKPVEERETAVESGLYTFYGTFDGNGHTISNFYQNTWEMKGDHNWYSAVTEQYYRDGMGLFGRVYGATIKNLTVTNFSSDGEIATTGVIAAYADCGSTFENIAIFNCNPRVYNIGNGGIVGCAGWYNKTESTAENPVAPITFKNITVDNSNKISALWGSYDVPCGGILGQYYPTSGQSSYNYPANTGLYFENCHVSAQLDVYNDVCANYQYYAYRYAGMLIGSVRENVTIDGHSYPKMDNITAKDCTVHFGDWNDYYYCELVANSLASYTHDHQMSRLEQVTSVDVENMTIVTLKGEEVAIPTSGRVNYVVVKAKDANGKWLHGDGHDYAECYHFVDGVQHFHDVADSDNPDVDETVNGETVLKEDKQLVYREFNNLVTGYGWGVTSKGVDDVEGVTILDREVANSVKKFNGKVNALTTNRTYTIDEIFAYIKDCGVKIVDGALNVTITNLDENGNVEATFTRGEKWNEGTISFKNTGNIAITIQDYYFCEATTINANVTERTNEEKFDVVMNNGDFLHRVGNVGTVALDKLFKAKDGVTVGTISVTVEAVNGTSASGTYSNNAIQFNGTGVVKVTITDNDYCIPTVLYLEVVEATNVTGLSGTISGDVVLLNNCGLNSLTVDGNKTVFGNGFTATYNGTGQYLNNGLAMGVITVKENGTLDNLRVKCSIYPTAFIYTDEAQASDNPYYEGPNGKAYYYQLSAVFVSGNATISNCYIYGARNNIYVSTGNVTIKDTVLECGTLSNVQIQSTDQYTVTLENVTTIQHFVNATIGDTSKSMLGTGIIVGPDVSSNPTIVLNGSFKQYNWVNEDDYKAMTNGYGQQIIRVALDTTEFNHTVNGKNASNLGIIFLNTHARNINNKTDLKDVYKYKEVTLLKEKGWVYSLQEASSNQIYYDYENADRATVNGDYIPRFDFELGNQENSYDGSEDTRYLYGDKNGVIALYQDGDAALTLDLTKLATIYKYDGINYTVTSVCKDSNGNILTATNGVVTLSVQGSYTLEFTVNDNIFYNNKGETVTKNVERTYIVPLTLTVKEADVKNAVVNITKTSLDGVYETFNWTDYKLKINFLEAISVTDYDNKGNGTTVALSSNVKSATITPDSCDVFTTAFTVTITYNDGRVLTVNFSKISGSAPGKPHTATIDTSGVYFITDSALNNKPTEASNQNKCTITSVSFKGNSGSTVTNDTDVSITWKLGTSSGCFAEGTMVTLADGTQKPIEDITFEDQILAWDFNTGKYVATVASLIDRYEASEQNVINLRFSDGAVVRMVVDHGFFDVDANKFVFLNEENVASYVGHTFVKACGDGTYENVELVGYEITVETVAYYAIQTAIYNNCIVEGMFTLTTPPEMIKYSDWFNYFEIGDDMKYDEEKMQADIEKYGLYTYEDFADYVTYEQFIAFNGPYLKVLVGRGVVTYEQIIELIAMYVNVES